MKNKASIWCYISGVISYITAVMYCISLIFLPIAIYCFIYGNRFFRVAKITESELAVAKPYLFGPAVGISIFGFPIGLIALVPYFIAGSNNVKVSSYEFKENPPEGETVKAEVDTVTISEQREEKETLSTEDLEKLEKLASFKNQGLLTEEEYNQAKQQIINKK